MSIGFNLVLQRLDICSSYARSTAAAQCRFSGISATSAPAVYSLLFRADLCVASPLSFLGFWLSVSFAGSQFRTVADVSAQDVVHTRVVSFGFQTVSRYAGCPLLNIKLTVI
jgi:hypothetical protein